MSRLRKSEFGKEIKNKTRNGCLTVNKPVATPLSTPHRLALQLATEQVYTAIFSVADVLFLRGRWLWKSYVESHTP